MEGSRLVGFNSSEISVPYGKKRRVLISEFDFELEKGQRTALIGPNGSGKSTILNAILGDKYVTNGELSVSVEPETIGYMPQNYRQALFPWLSVDANIDLYAENSREFSDDYFEICSKKLSLTHIGNSTVGKLSGGEQQLLLLSIILSRKCDLLLLDEPLSAVDLKRRNVARFILSESLEKNGTSMIMISHDMHDVSVLTENAVILSGSIEQPAKYLRSDSSEVYFKSLTDSLNG